jgi:ferritin-like metal-binding protein YciE
MAQQTATEAISRYLEDAIAAEDTFESQLRAFAKDAEHPEVEQIFSQHAEETAHQKERLTLRLQALGGKPSGLKGFLGSVFGMAPKAAQMGHDKAERDTQDLMAAYAVEHSEIAMYEALAVAASACGDLETERLARAIQEEERRAAEKVWSQLASVARQSFLKVTSGKTELTAA